MDKDELIDTAIMVAHFAARVASWADTRLFAAVREGTEAVATDMREVREGARDLRLL